VNMLWFQDACVHLLVLLHRVAQCITSSSVFDAQVTVHRDKFL